MDALSFFSCFQFKLENSEFRSIYNFLSVFTCQDTNTRTYRSREIKSYDMNYARHLHIGFLRTKVYWNFGWPVSLCTTQCVARLLRVFLEHSIEFNLIFSVFSSHWHLKKFADCSIPANFVSIKVSNQIHSTFRMYGVFVLGTNTSKKGLMDLFCAVGYQTFDANINFNLINCHNQTDAMLKARRKWSSKRKKSRVEQWEHIHLEATLW